MSSGGSVTHWIDALKAGDARAAQQLWDRYFERLVGQARARLQGAPRAVADEEDVALSAFNAFFREVGQGRFPSLQDRDDLWALLLTITGQRAIDLIRRERALKRGTGQRADHPEQALSFLISQGPTPEQAALVAEECERLLLALPAVELRSIAVWKMEGHTNEEIAAKLGCATRLVDRRLRIIRDVWSEEVTS